MCVGDVMLDVRADAGALAHGGDVHGRVVIQPGGTSANAAVWAAASGATAAVIGAVGDDVAADLVLAALARHGVDTGHIRREHGTTGTMLVLHEAGERSMVADRGANATLEPGDLPGVIEASAVLVSGYLLLQEPTTATALAALERTRAGLVAVETASWPLIDTFGAPRFFEVTALADAVLANDREAFSLTGRQGVEACRRLGERYRIAAVKRGAEGACLWVDGEVVEAPSSPVTEVDPTGAGDAFDGVVLAALARGQGPAEALDAACRAGARVAGSPSAWPEAPGGGAA